MTSTTIVGAVAAIVERVEVELSERNVRWPDDQTSLPDEPTAFDFFEMITDPGRFIEFGGGRGHNRFRNYGELHVLCFLPRGQGLPALVENAECVATVFRSFRGSGVSCQGATVHPMGEGEALVPPGLSSPAGNYSCAMVIVPLYFDQTA